MDKSLYNASGCKDRTAHDAISVTESNSRILRLERNMCEVEHGYRKTIRCYEQKRC